MSAKKTIEVSSLLTAAEVFCRIAGPAVFAYFVASFTVDKAGYYYADKEWGIALGVLLIAAGRVLQTWPRGANRA